MSKEYLEALKIGIPKLKKLYENNAKKMNKNDILGFDLTFVYLDKALKRLESIDNTEPSEALEGLQHIKKYYVPEPCSSTTYDYLETIKQALLKAQEQEKVIDLIKELKRLGDNINDILEYDTYEDYINSKWDWSYELTEEEFDLLKRYFR